MKTESFFLILCVISFILPPSTLRTKERGEGRRNPDAASSQPSLPGQGLSPSWWHSSLALG